MRIHPIHNDSDHTAAVKRIEVLLGATPGTPQGDELDILATLVVAYEKQHYPMLPPDPVSAILFQMEHQGRTRRDLELFIGSRARVSEVLSGKRSLTLPMIRRLSSGLNISADILVGSIKSTRTRLRARRTASSTNPSRPASLPTPRRAQAQTSRTRRRAA